MLVPHRPWRIMGKPKVLVLVRSMSFLIREIPGDAGIVLLQIWLLPKRLSFMSVVLAHGLLLK